MKKTLYILTLLTQLNYAATSEQVEQYLTVSHAEEELLALETQFSAMQNSFSQDTNSSAPYEMQMLSLRFRDYLERNISDDEMVEILENYRNVVLMQFINASVESENHDRNETATYVSKLKADSQSATRIELIEKISHKFYPKEGMIAMFEGLMKPLMQNGIGSQTIDDATIESAQERYIEQMFNAANEETLFATREFTLEELEELMTIAKTPAVDHESKALFGAMSYALQDFFKSMASRYDISKHQPKTTEDTKHTN
jgi:hypothetical protein